MPRPPTSIMFGISLALVAGVGAGCSASAPPAGEAGAPAALFDRLCTTCHGPTGQPTASMVARLNVRDLTAPEVRAVLTPARVEAQVRKGSSNKLMPGFEGLVSDAELTALAAWVASPAFLAPR